MKKVVVAGPAGPVLSALTRAFRDGGAEPVQLIHSAPGKHGRSRPVGGPDDPPQTSVVDLSSPALAEHLSDTTVVVLDCVSPDPDADLDRITRLRRRELVAIARTTMEAVARESARRAGEIEAPQAPGTAGGNALPGPQLIVITSAWALVRGSGAGHGIPGAAGGDDPGVVGDLRAVEHALATSPDDTVDLTLVRPAPLVAPVFLDGQVARWLGGSPRAGLGRWSGSRSGRIHSAAIDERRPASRPELGLPDQLCHVEDLATAVWFVARRRVSPVVGVETIPDIPTTRGRADPPWPPVVGVGTIPETPTTHGQTDSLWPPVVDTSALVSGGWAPRYDNAACRSVVEGRRAVTRDTPDRGAKYPAAAALAVTLAVVALAVVGARRRL